MPIPPPENSPPSSSTGRLTPRLLITAGPTHEPIDAVRYLANRSSGRLGIALADAAAARGLPVTLLLGPTHRSPSHPGVEVVRFGSTADLEALLREHFPRCGTLIMAAAVADYRPKPATASPAERAQTKLRRTDAALTLELEPTPDLLAAVARVKRPDQRVIGFALEPEDRLIASALSKLQRKHLDAIVANPLETMDSETVRATLLRSDGTRAETPGSIPKTAFAAWLLDRLAGA